MPSSQSMSEFYVTLTGNLLRRLLIPAEISRRHKKMCGKYRLQNNSGNSWKVKMRKRKKKHYFMEGWPEFVKGNQLEEGDYLVLCCVKSSMFRVDIFAKVGCDKGSTSFGDHGIPSNVTPISSETPLGGEPSTAPTSEFVPPNGYLCRQLPGEPKYPIDVDDPPDFTGNMPRRQPKRERGISPTMEENSTSKAPTKKGKSIGREKSLSDEDCDDPNAFFIISSSSSSTFPFQHTHTVSHSDLGQSVAESSESDDQDTGISSFQAYINELCKEKLVSEDTSSPSDPIDSSEADVQIEGGFDCGFVKLNHPGQQKCESPQEAEAAADSLPTEPVVADSPNEVQPAEEIPEDVPQNVPTYPPDTVSVPAAILRQQICNVERAISHCTRVKEELLALLRRHRGGDEAGPSGTKKADDVDESGEDGSSTDSENI